MIALQDPAGGGVSILLLHVFLFLLQVFLLFFHLLLLLLPVHLLSYNPVYLCNPIRCTDKTNLPK